MKYLPLAVYIATIFGANWAIQRFGFVPVGFGLQAPAGVYFAGLALCLRDVVQDSLGRRATVAAIGAGALVSYAVSPQFAAASGAAFLLSELADFAVYTPLRERHWIAAVVVSNIVGDIVDSALFLWLAFGSLAYIEGQLIGKWWMTVLAIIAISLYRRMRSAERQAA